MKPSITAIRRIIAAAAAVCAATLIPGTALASPGSAARPHLPPICSTSGLVVWLNTQGSATAGTVFFRLQFTNLSGHTCRLFGFPGVSGVNLSGTQLGSPARRDHLIRRVVILPPGATAHAVLGIVDVGNFSRPACRPVKAAGLRVFPPSSVSSKIVPFPFPACSRTGPVYLVIHPVRR